MLRNIIFASQGSNTLPIGTILPYVGNLSNIPKGWHLCDGSDGTPNLTDRFLEGTIAIPGIYKEPGLPNITGSSLWMEEMGASGSGAFEAYFSGSTGRNNRVYGNGGNIQFNFDASKSNPIYGASNTVQPSAYTVYLIMRIS